MRLYLINPCNPIQSAVNLKENRWNKYFVWKPLSLLVLAGLTPSEWDVEVIDENLGIPDYAAMPRPDLVGITAFTSQVVRAYKVATEFRSRGVPVVMGGIHATMCLAEALKRVDAVVTGEAESVWTQVLEDALQGELKQVYSGTHLELDKVPLARHELLPTGYYFGAIQTTRGCPHNCSFCSVTAFNGSRFRRRPIESVMQEFKLIKEKHILIVDDNLIGISKDHITWAKELFRAMIQAKLGKKWMAQVTINMADDDELLRLASKAGCFGVYIGFESHTEEGLVEVHKKFNIQKSRDLKASVRQIQSHGILVCGSFIMGLDIDKRGIGHQVADAATSYDVDILNVLFMTPLPGTRLWKKMELEDRIIVNAFPEDWKYYTLGFPVMSYKHLSWDDVRVEMNFCYQIFYSYVRILRRAFGSFWRTRKPLSMWIVLVSSLSYRRKLRLELRSIPEIQSSPR
ncbi:MAG: B12-binding domain-containing radical SAM protein [Candidatus Hodarchaeota archaeon]